MSNYKLYLVSTAKIKPGKFVEATKWWKEKGLPDLQSRPWAKSVKSYAVQFRLGQEYEIETWTEIENYAALDAMDNWVIENEEIEKMWEEANDYFHWGQSRLMGDFPESSLLSD